MSRYLEIDAMGSGRLEWLAVSPLYYRYMLGQKREQTEATALGEALHMAVLEPDRFHSTYIVEPEPNAVAPGYQKPRATKAYKDAVAELENSGRRVMRIDAFADVRLMADAIHSHPHAARVLKRAPEREVTGLWQQDGRLFRLRADMLGLGILGDIKTTRSLKDFSPWTVTNMGYWRQMALYRRGLHELGRPIEHVYFIAIESSAPYDVGVFTLDQGALNFGDRHIELLLETLADCERTDEWPGQFPRIETAMLSDSVANLIANLEVA